MRRAMVVGVILVTAVLAGCGDDDTGAAPSPSQAGDAVEVVAEDVGFDAAAYEATAGTVSFVYRNHGSITHTLVLEEIDGFKLEVTGNGDTDEGSTDLGAGTYTVFCDVPGHREAGMEATLVEIA